MQKDGGAMKWWYKRMEVDFFFFLSLDKKVITQAHLSY